MSDDLLAKNLLADRRCSTCSFSIVEPLGHEDVLVCKYGNKTIYRYTSKDETCINWTDDRVAKIIVQSNELLGM